MVPLYCRRTISILVTSLFLWHVETGDVRDDVTAQMSINTNCSWNYTVENSSGFELFKVFVTLKNYTTYYLETTRLPKFKIRLLGEEYDAKRQLYITWETLHKSNTVRVSYTDLLDINSIPNYQVFSFEIETTKHTQTNRKYMYRLRFDCIEIPQGVKLYVKVCDVDVHNRRQGRPTCNAEVIDTIRCSCNDTSINVSESKIDLKLNIDFSNVSNGMKISLEVKEEENLTSVYDPKLLTLLPKVGSIEIPITKLPPSNYTAIVTLYCRDYSADRVDKECQSQKFYFEIKHTQVSQVLPVKHPDKCGPIQKSCQHVFGFGGFTIFLVVVIAVCFIYLFKRRQNILALFTTRSGRLYDPVSPDSPSRPLNSYSLNNTSYTRPLQNNSSANTNPSLEIQSHQNCAVLSHHTPSDTNEIETERKIVENLKSNGVTVTYSWIDRQTAVLNWEQLSNSIANHSTDVIVFLSKALLDLLELSAKDRKTLSESEQLKHQLCDRNYENIPYATLKTLRSDFLRQVEGRKSKLHVICTCTTQGESETLLGGLFTLYPEFQPHCKVFCLKGTVDTFVASNMIKSRERVDSDLGIPLMLAGIDIIQVNIQRLKVV